MGAGVVPVAGGVALAPHEGISHEALVAQVPKELVVVVPVHSWLAETASVAKGAGGVGVVHTCISVVRLLWFTLVYPQSVDKFY